MWDHDHYSAIITIFVSSDANISVAIKSGSTVLNTAAVPQCASETCCRFSICRSSICADRSVT